MEEVLNYLECLLLIDEREDLVELLEVRSNEVKLLVAVEPTHLGSTLINRLSGVNVSYLSPHSCLSLGRWNKSETGLPCVLSNVRLVLA